MQLSHRSYRRSRVLRVLGLGVGLGGILLTATGCSLIESIVPAAEPATRVTEPRDVSAEPPVFVPGGSAQENELAFSWALEQYAGSGGEIAGQPLVNVLTEMGFDRSTMQVSFDQSRTGLVADSILVSALIGTDCLIGQVVTADRSVATVLAPALTDAANVCLIGNTRPIDW